MTVKELIETLNAYPQNAKVYVANNGIAFEVGTSIDDKGKYLEICCGTKTVDLE